MSGAEKIPIKSKILFEILTENETNHNFVLVEENMDEGEKTNIGSKIPYVPITKITHSMKPVDGKDLVVGKEYYESNKDSTYLGTFVGKQSEFFEEGSGRSSGYVHFYVFKTKYNKENKIRYYVGEEKKFFEKV